MSAKSTAAPAAPLVAFHPCPQPGYPGHLPDKVADLLPGLSAECEKGGPAHTGDDEPAQWPDPLFGQLCLHFVLTFGVRTVGTRRL
jgi:hypothetical protein